MHRTYWSIYLTARRLYVLKYLIYLLIAKMCHRRHGYFIPVIIDLYRTWVSITNSFCRVLDECPYPCGIVIPTCQYAFQRRACHCFLRCMTHSAVLLEEILSRHYHLSRCRAVVSACKVPCLRCISTTRCQYHRYRQRRYYLFHNSRFYSLNVLQLRNNLLQRIPPSPWLIHTNHALPTIWSSGTKPK